MGFREDAHLLLRHLDVFVLSSCLEGLGTSVLDAMALGVPVVATRTGGIPEMVEDCVSGLLVPPKDARALAAAVQKVLEDGALREKLKVGGSRTVERFSAQAMVRETRTVYEQVCARQAGRP
jgi:glycosyltransferase involved in cell wall biosynthesis